MKTVPIPNDIRPMDECCQSCPFRQIDGRDQDPYLADRVRQRILVHHASQLCHSSHGGGPDGQVDSRTRLCRGARDFLLPIFHRLGVIAEPTDEAWNASRQSIQRRRQDAV